MISWRISYSVIRSSDQRRLSLYHRGRKISFLTIDGRTNLTRYPAGQLSIAQDERGPAPIPRTLPIQNKTQQNPSALEN